MRKIRVTERRDFLASISAGTIGGMLWSGQADSNVVSADSEYLFEPGLIYLGTATLGPCPRRVVEQTMQAWYELETNPTATAFSEGVALTAAETVREKAAQLVGCSAHEIAITRSTTDGMNAIAQGLRLTRGDRVLSTDQEHPGGSSCWEYLAKRDGVEIDRIHIEPGEFDAQAIVDAFAAAIRDETRVISVSHVLSSTGNRMPIAQISVLAKSRDILCIVDGAQAIGGIDVDVKLLGCHAYATSGHKWLMGPKGTGFVYLSDELGEQVEPIQYHAGRRYYSASSGVGNLPGVIGLGVAIDYLTTAGATEVEKHDVVLRDRLYDGLQQMPKARIVSAPPGGDASPIVTFELPAEIDSEEFTQMLYEKHKIVVKMVPQEWLNGIRLSPHRFNTDEEVERFLAILRGELS